ncbi:nitroreductase family deazaflavin-dependent oxidoreductase [Sphaerobacter sp.]|uniref:nitroreductase family deazaflavin-dependent oxidoreductase n=1 Tax=Sphaerobacter sp. TaxID=2099654 RepID=UPI001DBAA92E|nr:nitroreductase family deazaflavin-dependent oxidoreductase [Sphaerobacter sp.]MBX5443686.1 nitroreductase family deazaflavin-dependent oxidoreductase [Sphaerobacter sp.]
MPSGLVRTKPRGLVKRLLRFPVVLYERDLGWLLGHRFLLLTHHGRTSGRTYRTVLEVLQFDPATRESIVVSAWGRRADWFRNVQAGGAVEVRTGRLRYVPAHRVLSREEAEAFFARWEKEHPLEARILPYLLGLDTRGPAARQQALDTVPFVAFRPRDAGEDDRSDG